MTRAGYRLSSEARVVLIDVNIGRRAVMRTIVDLALGDGTVVALAATASEALAAVDRNVANVAVAEIQLPVSEGLAVIARLRDAHPNLVIVVCTFQGDKATRQHASDAGSDAYLLKPVSTRQLREVLKFERPAVFASTAAQ
jgi:DNA-binding NarL/FixJ family response regulator